jgi:hypothetical protein
MIAAILAIVLLSGAARRLAGIAALSLLCVSAAQATEHRVELPDEMVGFGCYNEAKSTETEHHYFWGEGEDVDGNVCGDDDGIRISKRNYNRFKWEGNRFEEDSRFKGREFCTFEKIEIIDRPQAKDASKVYLVHADCWSGWGAKIQPPWTENLELQVIDDELVITELPEG